MVSFHSFVYFILIVVNLIARAGSVHCLESLLFKIALVEH